MALVIKIENTDGTLVASMVADDKVFSTGKTGFFAQGKIVVNGANHQVGVNIVKIEHKVNLTAGKGKK